MTTYRRLLLALAFLPLLAAARLDAQAADPLRVYLATYGPGEAVWEKFGHNAIWIQDARTGRTLSYNWGMFDFGQPGFVPRLLRGSMLYWMEARDAQREADTYAYYDRTITIQELALTAQQKAQLQAFVQWNEREENKFYNYHYFRDNCSTRVRDALDRVLGGVLRAQLDTMRTDETFRSHSLRLTASAPATYAGIELGLADSVDRKITAWEDAFVPMQLMRHLRDVQVTGPDGMLRPLVLSESQPFTTTNNPEPERKPNRVPAFLLVGVLIGGLFLLLSWATRARGVRAARWIWAAANVAWTLLAGVFGTLVLLLWTSTGHTFTYGNENLFPVNPLPILLIVPAAAAAIGYRWARRPAFVLAAFVALLAVLGLLLKPLPGFDQMNHDILALMIPAHLGFAAALLFRTRDAAIPAPRTAGQDSESAAAA